MMPERTTSERGIAMSRIDPDPATGSRMTKG
jgi:hypothetical protein